MDGRSARPSERLDACGPSPNVVIFHQFRGEADAHALALLQPHGLRPWKKEGAVDCIRFTRCIGKAYAFGKIRIEPHHDSVARPRALDGPLEIASNVVLLHGGIIQGGPEFVASYELAWTHADFLP